MSAKFTLNAQKEDGEEDKLNSSMLSESDHHRPRVLIGCSGSVAAVKIPEMVVALAHKYEVLVVCSSNASFFLSKAEEYNPEVWREFMSIGGYDFILQDSDEWEMWNKLGDEVLHIELRKWADLFLVAPASANLIAKASIGICDNLLLSIMRAWDFSKPCILCPAMNTIMWKHPSTEPALTSLKSWGWKINGPIEKLLACNEVGIGAMSAVPDIAQSVKTALEERQMHEDDNKLITPSSSNIVTPSSTAEFDALISNRSEKLSRSDKITTRTFTINKYKVNIPFQFHKIPFPIRTMFGIGMTYIASLFVDDTIYILQSLHLLRK
jgi:phosphopantothenoylcysteine decarboxylase